MYGYRYTPAGPVFELGTDLELATAEVKHRRRAQKLRNNPQTVELVDDSTGQWVFVPLPMNEDPEPEPVLVPAAPAGPPALQIPKHHPVRRRRPR